jgi:hypothetical protein
VLKPDGTGIVEIINENLSQRLNQAINIVDFDVHITRKEI